LRPPAWPLPLGSERLCGGMGRRGASLRGAEPALSASLVTFDPPASEAVLKALCEERKEAVANWKCGGLKNQDHRSGFPVSSLCNTGRAVQTGARRYAELSGGQERTL